jgi:xanthine dehydrogenase accessory factor
MHKDLEIWQFAANRLKRKEAVMLLVVTESSGSSPGRQGFKMIVAADDMAGSIGGGVMEVNLVRQARKQLAANATTKPVIKKQTHRKNAEHPSGMICSGKQTVVLFKLNARHLKTAEAIVRSLTENKRKILCLTAKEITVKEPPKGGTQNIIWKPGEKVFLYQETLGFKNKLFIIGGGHCALALSELMSKMDFHISLFDDRPQLNTIEKNKYADEKKIIGSYDNISRLVPAGKDNYVVVMTLGYKTDEIVIRKLLHNEFKYFGVLGSKAKMKTLLRNLEKEGLPKKKLDAIHTPIGLPINSQTPEEIAVSIAAEIIAVKNSTK